MSGESSDTARSGNAHAESASVLAWMCTGGGRAVESTPEAMVRVKERRERESKTDGGRRTEKKGFERTASPSLGEGGEMISTETLAQRSGS